jgi:hypothetical protein
MNLLFLLRPFFVLNITHSLINPFFSIWGATYKTNIH